MQEMKGARYKMMTSEDGWKNGWMDRQTDTLLLLSGTIILSAMRILAHNCPEPRIYVTNQCNDVFPSI